MPKLRLNPADHTPHALAQFKEKCQLQKRAWCFTVNNPGDWLPVLGDAVTYVVWQLERSESGTVHFQGIPLSTFGSYPNACVRISGVEEQKASVLLKEKCSCFGSLGVASRDSSTSAAFAISCCPSINSMPSANSCLGDSLLQEGGFERTSSFWSLGTRAEDEPRDLVFAT